MPNKRLNTDETSNASASSSSISVCSSRASVPECVFLFRCCVVLWWLYVVKWWFQSFLIQSLDTDFYTHGPHLKVYGYCTHSRRPHWTHNYILTFGQKPLLFVATHTERTQPAFRLLLSAAPSSTADNIKDSQLRLPNRLVQISSHLWGT